MATGVMSQQELATLELEGAVGRLLRGRQARLDFEASYMIVVGDEKSFRDVPEEVSKSLEAELRALLLEEDEAQRCYRHSFEEALRLGLTPPRR